MRGTLLHTNLVIDLFIHNTRPPPLGCITVITGVEEPSITGQIKKTCGAQPSEEPCLLLDRILDSMSLSYALVG